MVRQINRAVAWPYNVLRCPVPPSHAQCMQAFFLRGIAREKDMDDISLTDEAGK